SDQENCNPSPELPEPSSPMTCGPPPSRPERTIRGVEPLAQLITAGSYHVSAKSQKPLPATPPVRTRAERALSNARSPLKRAGGPAPLSSSVQLVPSHVHASPSAVWLSPVPPKSTTFPRFGSNVICAFQRIAGPGLRVLPVLLTSAHVRPSYSQVSLTPVV